MRVLSGRGLGLALASLLGWAWATPLAEQGADDGVRLIVVVSVDQLSPQALDPLASHLDGGIGRFLQEGTVFGDAEVAHGRTETAPGHASLGTGCLPTHHGVVANEWRLRAQSSASRSLGREYCFADADQQPLRQDGPGAGAGRSARNLRRPGFAELLRGADRAARSIAIAGKDRAAIGMAGHADWCLWWDQANGGFQSSTAWGRALPDWVRSWNATWTERLEASPFREAWRDERVAELESAPADERPGESWSGFPFVRPGQDGDEATARDRQRQALYAWTTPACDAFIVELALEALDEHGLGTDEHVDLLALGLSGCDVVGHATGPGSREVADLLLCADAALGALLEHLDQRVGSGRWIAVLSADHGVMPLPESLAAGGIEARRVAGDELLGAWEATHRAIADAAVDLRPALDFRSLWLGHGEEAVAAEQLAALRGRLAGEVVEAGGRWIERAYPWERLRAVAREGAQADPLLRLEAASFDEERSPDVSIVPRAGLVFGMPSGTGHGTPHDYDRRVPLVFLGPGFEPGTRPGAARTIDALPTLFQRAGLPLPEGLDGRVLPAD